MSTSTLSITDLCSPLTTPEEMRLWDAKATDDYGLTQNMLMENAGRAAWQVLRERCQHLAGQPILLLCGPGNNGGDGAVLARCLHDDGQNVLLAHSKPLSRYSGPAKFHMELARKTGTPCLHLRRGSQSIPEEFQQPAILADALLGTGFSGELREDLHELIAWINTRSTFVFSLDIPSGLNAMTGLPQPLAARTNLCATFEAAKPGLILPVAKEWVGELLVCPIGIPRRVKETAPASFGLLRLSNNIRPWLTPTLDMHKGRAGMVIVLGGSSGLTGAPHLAALAALRCGAGLVSVAAPTALCAEIKGNVPDIMTIPLGQSSPGFAQEATDERNWCPAMLEGILPRLLALRGRPCPPLALALGPGLGRSEGAAAFMGALLRALMSLEERPPLVLDADALYHLANNPAFWELLSARDLLTPHPGEAAKLLGCGVAEVERDRVGALRALCARSPASVVLKGAASLIGQGFSFPNHSEANTEESTEEASEICEKPTTSPLLISPYAEPNLAVGGSGDVLSGICACLLSRGLPALAAAALGVQIHGLCGTRLRESFPRRGNLASDIAESIPRVLADL